MKRRGLIVAVLAVLSLTFIQPSSVLANITSCAEVSITPSTVVPNSTTTFDFQLRNTDSNSIEWVDIQQPSGHYNISEANFSGWETDLYSDHVSVTGASLANNQILEGSLTATVPNVNISNYNWIVRVSDDENGVGAFYCSGDLDASISGDLNDDIPPTLSNLILSGLTHSSVTVKWNTNEPATSIVDYGLTEEYGQNKTDTQLAIDHQVTITGLAEDTGYFFQISGKDGAGNLGTGDSGTFLTAVAPPSTESQQTVTADQVVTTVPLTPGKEKVPPIITLTTKLSGVYKLSPEIIGSATDNDVLAKIEYSIDGGANWQSVNSASGLGTKKVNFQFAPVINEDGNYGILARAIDAALNIGVSSSQTLIIDTGPPVVGGFVMNNGASRLTPNLNGETVTNAGLDQRITLNATGGPTAITLRTTSLNNDSSGQIANQSYSLTQSKEIGLWSGIVSISQPGHYSLVADSVDGAGNTSSKPIAKSHVLKTGRITRTGSNEGVESVSMTLYVFEPTTKSWKIWDGGPYGQVNPQITGVDGSNGLFAPEGKYYIQLSSKNFRPARSQIFTLDSAAPINVSVDLKERASWEVSRFKLRLPNLASKTFVFQTTAIDTADEAFSQASLPNFELPTSNGSTLRAVDLLGKPTVLSVLNTWAPAAREQLSILNELTSHLPETNIIPVFLLESVSLLDVYQKIGGYQLNLVSDKSGQLAKSLSSNAVPTHYFINRKGIIQKSVSSVLSLEELTRELTNL